METLDKVSVLLNCRGKVCSVYASVEAADSACDAYNRDPWLAPGTPDPEAPYTTTTWHISDR